MLAGCDGAGPGEEDDPDPPLPDGIVYDVEYTDEAVVLEAEDAEALVEVDGARYTFDADALAEAGLTLSAGRVLLVEGAALRRITSVSEEDGRVVAETEDAALNELIESGTVAWELEVDFEDFQRASLVVAQPGANLWTEGKTCTPNIQGTTVTFTCQIEDYEMTFQVAAEQESASITYQVTKNTPSGATASFTGTGTVSAFDHQAQFEYSNSTLESADYGNDNLQVDMEIALAAAGSGSSDLDFALPVAALKIPFSVGPIPMFIGIGLQVVASLDVPLEAQASATASAAYSYNGATGLTFEGSSAEATATVNGHDFTDGEFDTASLFAPVDAQFGIAFPRISLNIFTQEIAWVQTGFTIGSRITFGPVCKSGYTRLLVDGGYDISLLGYTLAEGDTTLAERQRTASQDGCAEASSLRAATLF